MKLGNLVNIIDTNLPKLLKLLSLSNLPKLFNFSKLLNLSNLLNLPESGISLAACRRLRNRSILSVCEDFASKQDAEITSLYNFNERSQQKNHYPYHQQ